MRRAEKSKGNDIDQDSPMMEDRVVSINRCSKVVKGGRNFSFSALVVVGDRDGKVGVGHGKANEVSDAIRKGGEIARKSLFDIPLRDNTIPHRIETKFRGARIIMRPASPGTGLIAGGAMRAILELGGVQDILAKSLGSSNPVNVVKATIKAIKSLRTKDHVARKLGYSSKNKPQDKTDEAS